MGAKVSMEEKSPPRESDEMNICHTSKEDGIELLTYKSRSTTDAFFLIILTLFLTILLCFLGYCIFNGDIYRVLNGYDDCGNVCGKTNVIHYGGLEDNFCQSEASKAEPYYIILKTSRSSKIEKKCISNCSSYEGFRKFFQRCVQVKTTETDVKTFFTQTGIQNFFLEVSEDFHLVWPECIYICFIALAFSILVLILFRFLVGIVVWVVLVGVVLGGCISSVLLWLTWDQSRKGVQIKLSELFPNITGRKPDTYLAFAIITTIATIIAILLIIVMRKRIDLVVRLFKEAGKAITAMPFILLQPFLTFITLAIIVVLWLYFDLWIESSGHLTLQIDHTYKYQKDSWMTFTRWYNLLAMLWMSQFIIGCQHMVLAGAFSKWYFTRNKNVLNAPISKSFSNLIRYHLGSVALGSLIIASVQLFRITLKILEKFLRGRTGKCASCTLKCCQCCLCCFENFLKYINRNAYIEIAMYGLSFCTAARKAFRLLVANILRVTAINSVGDFVLFLGKVLIMTATVLCAVKLLHPKEGMQHMWVQLVVASVFAYFVSHCFMSVYEMAIDTIFLCFCEDCELNDGISKPYFMSRGLMEFVENSKKVLQIYDTQQRTEQAWSQNKLRTISESVDRNA